MKEQDYLMRTINDMVRFLAKVFLNKDSASYELPVENEYTQTDFLYKQLISMINEGKINEAENLLFEELDSTDKNYLEMALDFYERLNNFDDDFLESSNYSREEIEQGINAVAKEYGITI